MNFKIILYGATTYDEFKMKLALYDVVRLKSTDQRPEKTNVSGRGSTRHEQFLSCFNCGEEGHRSSECLSKQKGKKCFRCYQFGHIADRCSKRRDDNTDKPAVKNITSGKPKNHVMTCINDENISALVDTGADVSVLREDVYERIGKPGLDC